MTDDEKCERCWGKGYTSRCPRCGTHTGTHWHDDCPSMEDTVCGLCGGSGKKEDAPPPPPPTKTIQVRRCTICRADLPSPGCTSVATDRTPVTVHKIHPGIETYLKEVPA